MSTFTDVPYDVELIDSPQVGAYPHACRLPGRVSPLPQEALCSWLLRYADPFEIPPDQLLFGSEHGHLRRSTRWWRRADSRLIEALAERTGISRAEIGASAFEDVVGASPLDDLPERFGRGWSLRSDRSVKHLIRVSVCPRCLAGDLIPYIRRAWILGWATVCPIHEVALVERCPGCRKALYAPTPKSRERFTPALCGTCRFQLTNAPVRPACAGSVRLHQQLIQSHACGAFTLAGHMSLPWAATLGFFSVLVRVVASHTPPDARNLLFADISGDLRLATPIPLQLRGLADSGLDCRSLARRPKAHRIGLGGRH